MFVNHNFRVGINRYANITTSTEEIKRKRFLLNLSAASPRKPAKNATKPNTKINQSVSEGKKYGPSVNTIRLNPAV
ncbi:hypothetical protein [Acidiplasma cupricumulans]|uniref:hypothetical protein n=1 Tax=Acidiplasma cupricumulans TaxID=312540 RepID=UPI00191C40B2|nr:hypothetical protein [Acidiplasma cupricumulans]